MESSSRTNSKMVFGGRPIPEALSAWSKINLSASFHMRPTMKEKSREIHTYITFLMEKAFWLLRMAYTKATLLMGEQMGQASLLRARQGLVLTENGLMDPLQWESYKIKVLFSEELWWMDSLKGKARFSSRKCMSSTKDRSKMGFSRENLVWFWATIINTLEASRLARSREQEDWPKPKKKSN